MSTANAAARSGVQSLPPSGVYSLKWNNFSQHLATGLRKLFDEEDYTDVTLACDGQFIRAHKFLLSLCSPFFKKLFQVNKSGRKGSDDTIVILNNVRFTDLESILRFIYNGEANINNTDLSNFLRTGELLQIEGLSGFGADQSSKEPENMATNPISSKRNDARSSISPPVLPSNSQTGYRSTPVGNGQRIASASAPTSSAQIKKKHKLISSQAQANQRPLAPPRRASQACNAINSEVDPLEISGVDLQNTSMCDINDGQHEAHEMLVNVNDLKGEQFQYYTTSETANEEQMGFDESNEGIDVFDGYQPEQPEPCSSHEEISHGSSSKKIKPKTNRVVQNNGPHSSAAMPTVPRARTTSVDSHGHSGEEHSRPPSSPTSLLQLDLLDTTSNQASNLLASPQRPVLCVLCGRYFKNKNSLKNHRSTTHRGAYVLQKPEGGLNSIERESVPVPILEHEPPDYPDMPPSTEPAPPPDMEIEFKF